MFDTLSETPPARAGLHRRFSGGAATGIQNGPTVAPGRPAGPEHGDPADVAPANDRSPAGATGLQGMLTVHGDSSQAPGLTRRESGLVLQGSTSQVALSALGQRKIGEILIDVGAMTGAQVQLVLDAQRGHGNRLFGDIAISLGYARRDQVIWALSQQFGYSYSGSTTEAAPHRELIMANAPFSDEVECFRNLRSDLSMSVLSPADPDRPALALVSANIGDGKTFVLSNLAVAFSQARMRTLVIDADMRAPRLHEVFNIDNRVGLSNVLSGRTEMQVVKPVSYLPNLYMLSAGTLPPNPTELIHHPSFELLMRELRSMFDVVLVDTPASVHGSDAAAIAARCGAALVIARKGKSRVGPLQHLMGRLKKGGVNVAGVMMNTA